MRYFVLQNVFLSLGEFNKAKNTYQKAKSIFSPTIQVMGPIVIIDDSKQSS